MDGKALQARRARLGMSQAQLAAALGVSRNTVARWERDEMAMPAIMLSLALETIERNQKSKSKK